MNKAMKSALHFSVSCIGISALSSVPFKAMAQEQEQEGSVVEEMVITARKRVQSIQDVPVSVQAFDTQDLREQGLRDFEDYARNLTSVSFGTSSPGATTIAFRGALAQPTGFDTPSSSILYLDEVPITRDGQNPDVRLIDIERLEALAGPQPTVYGAGSQSGTLKIVTNRPVLDEFGGFVQAGASVTKDGEPSFNIEGALNVPIVEDKLAVRLVGFYDAEGGFIDNVLGTTSFYSENSGDRDNAAFVEDDINDYDVYGARARVLYQPNENWSILADFIYQAARPDGQFDFNPDAGFLNTVKFRDEQRDDDWYNAALTIEGDLGFANLTLAGGYHSRNIDYDLDSTAYMTSYRDNGLAIAEYYTGVPQFPNYETCSYYYICFVNYNDFGPNPTGTISLNQRVRSFVQEVRLTSKDDTDSRFSWMVGAFYERTNNDWDYISRVDDFAENGGQGAIFYYYGVEPTDVWFDQGFSPDVIFNGEPGGNFNGYIGDIESIALFGQVSFDITDQLTLEVGGRWFNTDFRIQTSEIFVGVDSGPFDQTLNTKDFNPEIILTYKPTNDILLYAKYAQGSRIGGVNILRTPLAQAAAPASFGSDVLNSYEAGVKSTWLDGRLIANLTFFIQNWKDFQIQTALPGAGAVVVNAGNASLDGVEGQFAFKPTDRLEFSAAFTYLDATIDDDLFVGPQSIQVANAGDVLPATPKWKVNASVEYNHPIDFVEDAEVYVRFDANHIGNSVNGLASSVALFGAGTAEVENQPAYQLGYLSLGMRKEEDWEIWLSVNNIWNEQAVTYIWPRFSDGRQFTVRPREFRIGLYKPF